MSISHITVDFAEPSAPAEIRDGEMRLVAHAAGGERVKLDPGPYLLSATLPDGREETRTIRLAEGQDARVEIGEKRRPLRSSAQAAPLVSPSPKRARSRPGRPRARRVETDDVAFRLEALVPSVPDSSMASVEVARPARWHARTVSGLDGSPSDPPPELLLLPVDGDAEAVDIVVRTGDLAGPVFLQTGRDGTVPRNVALPVGPFGECRIRVTVAGGEPRPALLTTGSSSTDAEAVADYLVQGRVVEARDLTIRAKALLFEKINDPIAAAIGGYALLRLGAREHMYDWPRNLANWFEWLPDGAVIAAEVALRDGDREEANRLVDVALQRGLPIFTDGLALLGRQVADGLGDRRRGRRHAVTARFAELGTLTVTLAAGDPTRPGATQDVRHRFGGPGRWVAFCGTEPEPHWEAT